MQKKVLKKYFIGEINSLAWLLISFGTIIWSVTMIKSGLVYSFGMGFWGANGHDGIWHIALSQSLANGSWQMPIFAGEMLKNYHLGFDLLLAILHKLTFIPIHTLYFQVLPPILAFGIGLFVYLFILSWNNSKTAAWWTTFFVYFGGNWGWLISLIKNNKLGGESMFWSQQSISTLVNPPFALSLLFIFSGLYFLLEGTKAQKNGTQSTIYYLLSTFLFGLLVQIKVYAGILVVSSLFFAGMLRLVNRKGTSLLKVFTGSLILSILFFSPSSRDIGQTLIFKPFWFLETMMTFPDRFGWTRFGEAMVNYKLAGNWLKAIPTYTFAFLLFLFGNLGTRVIGGFWFMVGGWRKLLKSDFVTLIILSIIAVGLFIPLLFIQSGTPWNTIQFFYYSLIFSGVLAGVYLGEVLEKAKKLIDNSMIYHTKIGVVILLIILFTLPTTLSTLWYDYLPSRPPAKISNEELEALLFLRKQQDGTVLTLLYDKVKAEAAIADPPRPLYLYESTAYVSAFSGKPTFLEDEVNLEITGYDWRSRRADLELFLKTPNQEIANNFLGKNNISYIYWVKPMLGPVSEGQKLMTKIFENEEVQIFKVN